jgi:hypothetical protein
MREFCISNGTIMPEVVTRTVDCLSEQFRHLRHGNIFCATTLKSSWKQCRLHFYAMNMQFLTLCTDMEMATQEPLLIINFNSQTGECQLKNC